MAKMAVNALQSSIFSTLSENEATIFVHRFTVGRRKDVYRPTQIFNLTCTIERQEPFGTQTLAELKYKADMYTFHRYIRTS